MLQRNAGRKRGELEDGSLPASGRRGKEGNPTRVRPGGDDRKNQGDARRRRHSGVNNVEEMSLIVKYGTGINLCSATSAEGLNRVDDLAPLR